MSDSPRKRASTPTRRAIPECARPLPWLQEHLADIVRVGQTFPCRPGGFGSGVDPSRCSGVGSDVAAKPDIVKALFGSWRASPLSLGDSERQLLVLKGLSLHGTEADVMRLIGEHPEVPFELPSSFGLAGASSSSFAPRTAIGRAARGKTGGRCRWVARRGPSSSHP